MSTRSKIVRFIAMTSLLAINLLPIPVLGANKKIAFVGSSSFDAFCHTQHYDKAITDLIPGSTSICPAKSGAQVAAFLEQYNTNVKGKGFTDLVIYAGLNGLTSDAAVKSAQKNLITIFSQAKAEGIRVVVVSAQPYKAQAEFLKKNHAWLATKPGGIATFINLYPTFDANNDDALDTQYGGPALHVNSAGYKIMFQAIAQEGFGINQGIQLKTTGGDTASGVPANVELVQKKLSNEEIASLVSKPVPKIKIPGLNFTNFTVDDIQERPDGSVYISMPFIGEYLAASFKYLIVIAGIIATARLIMAGFLWTLPTASGQDEAKKMIIQSLSGLALAIGGYSILYAVNPNLVSFAEISIPFIPEQEIHYTTISDAVFTSVVGSAPLGKEETIALAKKLGAEAGLPKCIMDTIMSMESGGKTTLVGHDENFRGKKAVSSRKSFLLSGKKYSSESFTPVTDPSSYEYAKHNSSKILNNDEIFINSPPDYGIDWRFTHGFGAGQITFGGDSYCNNARGIIQDGTCYTIPQLLNPATNLQVTVKHVQSDFTCASKAGLTGDDLIRGTFASYNAGCGGFKSMLNKSLGEVQNFSYAKKAFAIYQKCLDAS